MEQKFREIQLEEVTNVKRITITSLFIISKGLLYNKRVLLYYLRCYQYQTGILETVLANNKISSKIQSLFFLKRLGFINNSFEKSLTIVYECPEKGEILTIEGFMDQEMDKGRKLKLLNEMFQVVYYIKKKNASIEIGCIYPHLFFCFFDLDKHILMVDYIFSSLFQSSKNNTIRLLNGYFGSINCDEILMSCLLLSFFFNEVPGDSSHMIQIIQMMSNTLNQSPEVQAQFLAKNIEIPLIKTFFTEVFIKKDHLDYVEFYEKFKELNSKLKDTIPKADLKINERFFRIIGEMKEEIVKILKKKSELEFFFKHMPTMIEMNYSKDINAKYFNAFEKDILKKNNKMKEINVINEEYNELLSKYESKIKEYLKYKLDKIKSQPNISEEKVNKLKKRVTELKDHIYFINDANTDSSLLINLENDNEEIIHRLIILKTQILPRLFQEYLTVMGESLHIFQSESNVNFLSQKPLYPTIKLHYYPFIKQCTKSIEIYQYETDAEDTSNSQQVKLELNCEFKTENEELKKFPKNCKWLKYLSFIVVNGGENSTGKSISNTMIIDLTQKTGIVVHMKKDMKTPKNKHSLCMYRNFYMLSLGGDTKSAELYSILSDEWNSLQDLNKERENGVLCLFNEEDLYYFGGKEESNTVDHLKMTGDISKMQELQWDLIELDNSVSFLNRAYIKKENHKEHKLLILGGSISNASSVENYQTFMIDFNQKKVEEYKSKITFNLNYQFYESEMNCINNSYIQIGIDNKSNATLVSFAQGLFVLE